MKRISIISLTLFTILFSCKKVSETTPLSDFPNNVGNHWRYEFQSTDPVTKSYIDVDIIGTGKLPNGQLAKIWVYSFMKFRETNLSFRDTNYVVSDDKNVIIYANPCRTCAKPQQMPYEKMKYVLPLKTGNFWLTPSIRDTTKVLVSTVLNVPAGNFKNTFELSNRRAYVTNSWTNNVIWFTPNIGMTKLKQSQFDLGPYPTNGNWELIDYSLKE
jgi:hypothetical protein